MKEQHKATLVGLILGVVIGLFLALAVAVYVTKVPVPFLTKAHSRSSEQDAAEAKKNKDWNPNAPLQTKTSPRTSSSASSAPPAPLKPLLPRPAVTADPLGDLAKARSTSSTESYAYVIQVGAFRTPEDAESQRAKLSLSGVEAKVSEREQAGKTLYRVRVGPIASKDEAAAVKGQLDAAGYETTLLRMQR